MTISNSDAIKPLKTRNVTAVLGPTNTGKTHLAIERMVAHKSGMIGLPLRLLAREVYDRVVAKVGVEAVALITGEEKIKPEGARFWVCTVEAMPRDIEVDFLAVDEVQLAADPERGHIFTERLFYARGQSETLLLGAGTMREAIKDLMPGANFVSRPRLSKLTYAGQKKLSRLPRRSAVVAFSAAEVYEIAELMRRQRGGAAVVLGALSPRTRNAQVALYQNGEVDFLVATDAVGMGLNLDVDHVAFAGIRKFDGREHRNLTTAELAQIAGRAGRHMNDGTFGVTGDAEPLSPELIDKLEKHEFDPVKTLQWRSVALDFSSIDKLKESLREFPDNARLARARLADDVLALDSLSSDAELAARARSPEAVRLMWDVCQIPDYRKVSPASHAELVANIYRFVSAPGGRIPEDWFSEQVGQASRTDGDIDTLSNRLAHIRTWTFVSNRSKWLANPQEWQAKTRGIEDALSDALHEQLTQRFVDRRTSTLMKALRDDEELNAEISDDGAVHVEKHFVGKLIGFRFAPEAAPADSLNAKAARSASVQVLGKEMAMRARRVASAKSDAFKLDRKGARVLWRNEEIGKLELADDALNPSVLVLCDEHLSAPDKEKVQTRLNQWLAEIIEERLKPLMELGRAEDITGLARGVAFQLRENFGVLKREAVAKDLRELDQEARAQLRKYGTRFGAFNLYIPLLLKPASTELLLTLWMLKNAGRVAAAEDGTLEPPRPGLTSVPSNAKTPEDFYRTCGYHLCGPRAVRVDMLERLSDMIRPLIAFRINEAAPEAPPKGSSGDGGFIVLPNMMSILGCGAAELTEVLKALGFRSEKKEKSKAVAAVVVEDAAVARASGDTTVADVAPAEGAADAAMVVATAVADEPAPLAEMPAAELVASSDTVAVAVEEPAVAEAAVVPSEPEFIEVWRPRRRRDEQPERKQEGGRPRQNRNNYRPNRAPGQQTPAMAAASVTTDAEGNPLAPAGDSATAVTAPPRPPKTRTWQVGRPDGEQREAKPEGQDDGGKSAQRGKPGGERHKGGDRNRDRQVGDRNREFRSNDAGKAARSGGDRVHSSGPETKRGSYDPASPFAALSALKQQLEDRKRS